MRKLLLLTFVLLILCGTISNASANPVVGICTMLSSSIIGDDDRDAPDMIIEAVNKKYNPMFYTIDRTTSATDFKNYLGSKEILVSDVSKMMQDFKLPLFLEYAASKKLDYLMVVFCDTKSEKYVNNEAVGIASSGTGFLSGENRLLTKKVELLSRVVIVDVKKEKYIYNVLLNTTAEDNYGFRSEIRGIRAAMRQYVKEFDKEIQIGF